jgi:hypothetical protein
MSSRLGNWAIGFGIIVSGAGLCILPAAFGKTPSPDLVAMGATLFSMGAMIISGGIYLKARSMQSSNPVDGGLQGSNGRRSRGGCDLCGLEAPVVLCKIHQLHLCGSCLAQHYDVRSCIYQPTFRKPGNKPVKAIAKARGA